MTKGYVYFEDFIGAVGEILYSGDLHESDSDVEYVEGGSVIAIVENNDGEYKIIATVYSNDPWHPAKFSLEQQKEIISSAWLNRRELLEELAEDNDFDDHPEELDKALAALGMSRNDIPEPDLIGYLRKVSAGENPPSGRASELAYKEGLIFYGPRTNYHFALTDLGKEYLEES